MKKIIIYLMFTIMLLGVIGCTNQNVEKKVLYKYNIEDYDYNADSYKAYSIEYNGIASGYETNVSIRLEFNNNNTCNYYGTYKNDTGTTTLLVEKNCSYVIEDNKILVKIESLKQIYEPSYYAKRNGYDSNISYESNVEFDGEILENGKILKIGNLNYHHVSYLYFLGNGMEEILIDPETKKQYMIDGTPAGNRDPEYIAENSINLSKYNIEDYTNK